MSFGDRFFTPQTARALLSWRILLAAVIGVVAGVLGLNPGAAVGLGLAVYAATVLAAMPSDRKTSTIDAFTLSEPWRRFVQGAQRSRAALYETVKGTTEGPLKDRLTDIAGRLDGAIEESWTIAKRGDEIDEAIKRIDPVRLDELVARAAEVSVGRTDESSYEHDVDKLVIELEGLRQAVAETNEIT